VPEQVLVERLKHNSTEAFEELVATYARRLYSVSMRILRNPQDAEDAVQETFLKAFQTIEDFREESSLYTWLYRIVCNQSLMKLRQQRQHPVIPIEPYLPSFERGQHSDQIQDWNRAPDFAVRSQELAEFLEKCIQELPEDYRLAYILKDVEKLSEDHVCQILGVTKPAMKNRVHSARLVIRKRIEDHFLK
jgi:RNA polymerase sigma-70 factor (ECF subfamily)